MMSPAKLSRRRIEQGLDMYTATAKEQICVLQYFYPEETATPRITHMYSNTDYPREEKRRHLASPEDAMIEKI
ncbi:hypothetical protein KQX54_021870 [Cotesia glomerata]|uniref:Uncharacterized protein n=1 Tax=Cotesia glomerata TaxID=32391 RepID=A0AAV7J871_COTGL|nr:hypothetical protein KQX54_021870 [Cotesia glomerata]